MWIIPLAIGVFVGYCFLDSYISGWNELSKAYRTDKAFKGKIYSVFWINTSLSTSMNGMAPFMMFGANAEGLYIAVPFFLRIAHPPLFVPWHDISTITAEKIIWFKRYALQITKAPDVSLVIGERIGKHLARLFRVCSGLTPFSG